MRLRDVDFGHVMCASGARNFDGSGWWWHRMLRPFGLDYSGSTLVAKTTTFAPRKGNMGLDGIRPTSLLPDCVVVKPLQGAVLNAVGLSGPGVDYLLQSGLWDLSSRRPFFMSFMAVSPTPRERLLELQQFVDAVSGKLTHAASAVGLQINFSCPNANVDPLSLADEMWSAVTMASTLDIPLVAKVNALFPHSSIMEIGKHPGLDAICSSNTIPWGKLPDRIDWKGIFGSSDSPLAKYGGGGLSGAPVRDLIVGWISGLRLRGFMKPIIGCGGILSRGDADAFIQAGSSAVELGSVSILRPWRVQGIIRHVNRGFGRG